MSIQHGSTRQQPVCYSYRVLYDNIITSPSHTIIPSTPYYYTIIILLSPPLPILLYLLPRTSIIILLSPPLTIIPSTTYYHTIIILLSHPLPILLYLLPRTTILLWYYCHLPFPCLIKSMSSSGWAFCVDSNDDGNVSKKGFKSSVKPTLLSPSLTGLKMDQSYGTVEELSTCLCRNLPCLVFESSNTFLTWLQTGQQRSFSFLQDNSHLV